MFLSLLGVTLAVSLLVCYIMNKLFTASIDSVLAKIVNDDVAHVWAKYMKFAVFVVGISGGVNVYYLANFIKPPTENFTPPVLDFNHWVLEIYRTIIESLQSIAWLLLIFFIFALIAYVIATKANK